MGTRHLVAVQVDGVYKVAQYGQWDGYPSGQGKDVLNFLRRSNLNTFTEKVRACTFITQEELERRWESVGAVNGGATMDVADRFQGKWPQLSRNTGAKVLEYIFNQPPGAELKNSLDFAGDSLFCEWAYVVDLDKGTFEVFEGFNKTPLDANERFASAPLDPPPKGPQEYFQVKHKTTYTLDALPSEEQFLADNERENEE